jgi:hypothetical protein
MATTDTQATYIVHMRCEDGGTDEAIIHAETLGDAIRKARAALREWIEDGEWGDDGASVWGAWELSREDDSGEKIVMETGAMTVDIEPDHERLMREAGAPDDCDHDWTSEGEGGCDENPGVWATGGTSMTFASHCRKCGLHRTEHHTGSQRNPGEHDTVEYEMPGSWCPECEREECECGD